jgi:beta-lactamase class A
VITWAASDGREEGGDRVVPAASTIKIFVASAFWRAVGVAGGLDPAEQVEVPPAAWSVADRLAGPVTLADCALLMLAFSDNAATNVLLDRIGLDAVNEEAARLGAERTQVRRPMMTDGAENLTCARDLARGLAAVDEERVFEALALAQDSELHFRLAGREVLVKTGELWPAVYHEVALVDRKLAVAVCSAPAALPHEVAARAAWVIGHSPNRVDSS